MKTPDLSGESKKSLPKANSSMILFLISWGIVMSFVVYYSGWLSLPATVISILLYGSITYLIALVFSVLFGRKRMPYLAFMIQFVRKAGALFALMLVLIGTFAVYQNEIDPAELTAVTISNGEKTIVFQSMAHIGSDRFYKEVTDRVRVKKAEGYDLFFEGVRPGNEENTAKFDRLMGFEFSKELYPELSRMYGLRAQDTREYLGFSGWLDVNADVSIDDIITSYEAKYAKILIAGYSGSTLTGSTLTGSVAGSGGIVALSGSGIHSTGALMASGQLLPKLWSWVIQTGSLVVSSGSIKSGSGLTSTGASEKLPSATISGSENPLNLAKDIHDLLNELSPRQLAVFQYLNRATMNFLVKHQSLGLEAVAWQTAPGLFETILDARNEHLVKEIERSKSTKIIITYGALHFDGLFDILQAHDSRWKISGPVILSYPTRP